MTTCLHVACGPYQLLFDIASVLEVGDVPAAWAQASHRPWRERNLPVIDLRARLGTDTGHRRQQLVLDDGAAAGNGSVAVDVDRIVGIRECRREDRVEFPPLHDALDSLVDGGWLDRDTGTCLLHVHLPITGIAADAEPPQGTTPSP